MSARKGDEIITEEHGQGILICDQTCTFDGGPLVIVVENGVNNKCKHSSP